MNCPNCGAPLQPYPDRGYSHCDHCGTFHFPEESKDRVRVLGDKSHLRCPACHQQLVGALVKGRVILHCPNCKGILSTQASFATIVRRLRAEYGARKGDPGQVSLEDLARQLVCPTCGREMSTHPYAGPGNVAIDVCAACETIFLDSGELSIIRDAPGRE